MVHRARKILNKSSHLPARRAAFMSPPSSLTPESRSQIALAASDMHDHEHTFTCHKGNAGQDGCRGGYNRHLTDKSGVVQIIHKDEMTPASAEQLVNGGMPSHCDPNQVEVHWNHFESGLVGPETLPDQDLQPLCLVQPQPTDVYSLTSVIAEEAEAGGGDPATLREAEQQLAHAIADMDVASAAMAAAMQEKHRCYGEARAAQLTIDLSHMSLVGTDDTDGGSHVVLSDCGWAMGQAARTACDEAARCVLQAKRRLTVAHDKHAAAQSSTSHARPSGVDIADQIDPEEVSRNVLPYLCCTG